MTGTTTAMVHHLLRYFTKLYFIYEHLHENTGIQRNNNNNF